MHSTFTGACPRLPTKHRFHRPPDKLCVVAPPSLSGASILWTCGAELLLSRRVIDALARERCTGYVVHPISVQFRDAASGCTPDHDIEHQPAARVDEPHATYFKVTVTGWAGVAGEASGVRLISKCDGCGRLEYSGIHSPEHLLQESAWDGSDFAMLWPMPLRIFVSARAKELLHDIADHSLRFRTPRSIYDDSATLREMGVDGYTPGRLVDWMPCAVARERGLSLGLYNDPVEGPGNEPGQYRWKSPGEGGAGGEREEGAVPLV